MMMLEPCPTIDIAAPSNDSWQKHVSRLVNNVADARRGGIEHEDADLGGQGQRPRRPGRLAGGLVAAPGVVATQGESVVAGQRNDARSTTAVFQTDTQNGCVYGFTTGIAGCGATGVEGYSEGFAGVGVSGVGVMGSADTGTGVYGTNRESTGIGVHGRTEGVGSAVYGEATAGGVGVNGDSANGTGVRAASPGGTALQVHGKATFSRSGILTIAAGTASKTVTLAGVTTASMVLATAQQNKSVTVKAAVPAAGSFKIFLTGNAPTGGLKVAYFVLN